jgi:hypothetical protein
VIIMKDQEIDDVPADSVGSVVQSFVTNDKAAEVEVTKQADGKYTIKAQIP